MHLRFAAVALFGGGLAACAPAPISVQRAMAQCSDRARQAVAPSGRIVVGVGSGGVRGGVSIGVTEDFLRGRDPVEVYNQCVLARSGQNPTRPLVL
jgi:hypothetical protein